MQGVRRQGGARVGVVGRGRQPVGRLVGKHWILLLLGHDPPLSVGVELVSDRLEQWRLDRLLDHWRLGRLLDQWRLGRLLEQWRLGRLRCRSRCRRLGRHCRGCRGRWGVR